MAENKFICRHAPGCELYGAFSLQGALRIWKSRFCQSEDRHSSCERYILSAKGEPVPRNLLPNGESLFTL